MLIGHLQKIDDHGRHGIGVENKVSMFDLERCAWQLFAHNEPSRHDRSPIGVGRNNCFARKFPEAGEDVLDNPSFHKDKAGIGPEFFHQWRGMDHSNRRSLIEPEPARKHILRQLHEATPYQTLKCRDGDSAK